LSTMAEDNTSEPTNGSWVAELEDAKDKLSRIADRAAENDDGAAAVALLKAHLRVCRAYRMLRQWERLAVATKRGVAMCRSLAEASTTTTTTTTDDAGRHAAVALRELRKIARAELSVKSSLNQRGATVTLEDSNDDDEGDDDKDDEESPPLSGETTSPGG
jgi:hypothetical protein